MGEKRGGPMGVETQSVRLDPPKGETPLGDEGEDHAAAVLKAAQSAQASISGEGEEEGDKTPLERVRDMEKEEQSKKDEQFMEKYQGLNINELILTGRLSHTFNLSDDCIFEIQTLTENENIEIESELTGMINSEQQMASSHVSANIRRHILARSIKEMNGQSFGDSAQTRFEKIGNMSAPLVLHIHMEYRKLNRAVSILLTGSSGNPLERLLIGREPL